MVLFLCQAKGEHSRIAPQELCPFPGEVLLFSHGFVSDSFATPWTAACQASLSIGFSSQEYWSGLPFPSPGQPKYAYYELSISIYDHHYGIVAHLSIFFHILDVLGLL